MQRETVAAAVIGLGLCLGCSNNTTSSAPAAASQGGRSGSSVSPSSPTAGRTSTTLPPQTSSAGTPGVTLPSSTGAGVAASLAGGAPSLVGMAGSGGVGALSTAGSPGSAGSAAGSGAQPNAGGAAPAAGSGGAPAPGGASNITGTLGTLGPVQPLIAGWATTNGLETLVYLSSAPLTCAQMMTRGVKWLSTLPAHTQVIEIVVGNPSAVKSYAIGSSAAFGGGEVNYAEGSKSSSTEVTGKAGTIMFTTATAKGVQEGTINVSAPFMASGTFHAEWCEGGTEY
jgi:hypothetical protein